MMFLLLSGLSQMLLSPQTASAQAIAPPPQAVCRGLVGCGQAAANVVATGLPTALEWMLSIAAAICLLMIMWSGFSMVISLGDEGKISKGRWNALYALIGLVLVVSAQVLVGAVGTLGINNGGSPLDIVGNAFATLTRSMRILLNVSFTIMAVIAGLRMVYARGKSEEYEKGKAMIFGAILGALIINLATALIRAVLAIFNIS